MIDPKIARYWDKANSMQKAWVTKFETAPSMHELVLAMAHGEFETRLGDSWPGEHNVGAVQERTLNVAEKTALYNAGIVADFKNVVAAKEALKAAGLRYEGLHGDSSPIDGKNTPYFVFFRVFPSDIEGDSFFLHVICEQRPACRAILMDPAGTEQQYAAALYASKYFEGFHDPKATYELQGDKWVKVAADAPVQGKRCTGAQLNIDSYASSLRGIASTIRAALAGWTPGAVPVEPPQHLPDPSLPDLRTVKGQQQALNRLGQTPPLTEDGKIGPKTLLAIKTFQTGHGLTPDGVIGPRTRAVLQDLLQGSGHSSGST